MEIEKWEEIRERKVQLEKSERKIASQLGYVDIQKERQINGKTDRQIHRQADRQVNRTSFGK